MAKVSILMVCLGNICRSPVAEGLMRSIALEKGLDVIVDSAGTSGLHSGEAPDRRSQKNAKKNGVDISDQCSRKFSVRDFDRFDRIYVMDESNYDNVIELAENSEHKKKVFFLLDALYPGKKMPVPDPWYGGEQGFEEVFQLVKRACQKIAEDL
ncbi:MAG: low molecular weight phosphotyrosine protein phosphatase [Bacteroidia bacterium]|nr:low molecular weight phosphotyrosine protein phosphatase [Bacteroidia bacterium]